MTDSLELEYQIACIAHGEEAAMWETLRKNEATMEEVSYVLYGDEHLLKAVLDDPNWAGRILKQNPPDPAAMQAGFMPQGQQAVMNTPMGQVGGPPVGQQSMWNKLNPLSSRNNPMTAWQQDMEKLVGGDAMRDAGMATAKPGWGQRMKDTMSGWKENRAAAREQRAADKAQYLEDRGPGVISSIGDALNRRRQAKIARLTGRSPAEQDARAAGGEIGPEGEFVHPEAPPEGGEILTETAPAETLEEIDAEAEARDPAAEVAAIGEGASEVGRPQEVEAGEVPWWAGGRMRGDKHSSGEGFTGMGAVRAAQLGKLGGPQEGETLAAWGERVGAKPGMMTALGHHMPGGKHHEGSRLFGAEGLGGEGEGRGWAHGFAPAEAAPAGAEGPATPELPSQEEVATAGAKQTPESLLAAGAEAQGAPAEAQAEDDDPWAGTVWDTGTAEGMLEAGKDASKKEKKETTPEMFALSDDSDAMNMAWNHLTMLKSNWATSMRNYE